MAERLKGKIAVVTGGASGIGLGIARRFASEGAVVILADRDGDRAADEAGRIGQGATGFMLDVTQEPDWQRLADHLRAGSGAHILVNNAGICVPATIETETLAGWRRTFAVNLDGVFLGINALISVLAETCARSSGHGSVLNISSVSAMVASANLAGYNASKAGVRHLTKSVALHCARQAYPITCNSLHPTFIDTPLLDGFVGAKPRAAVIDKLQAQIPLGRIGQVDDVAWAAVYLCSDEASFVTGSELLIDGGLSAA